MSEWDTRAYDLDSTTATDLSVAEISDRVDWDRSHGIWRRDIFPLLAEQLEGRIERIFIFLNVQLQWDNDNKKREWLETLKLSLSSQTTAAEHKLQDEDEDGEKEQH